MIRQKLLDIIKEIREDEVVNEKITRRLGGLSLRTITTEGLVNLITLSGFDIQVSTRKNDE